MPQLYTPRDRSWGSRFDALPSSPPSTPESQPPPKKRPDKLPHDASIFVGSLPTNVDQHDLSGLLSKHLSDYAQVRTVKVIRDSKGGVCAFVQCEDATAATQLLCSLNSSPSKPFLGRTLRFEQARAFRTLLISYRAPTQVIPTPASEGVADLPEAVRIYRTKNIKYYEVSYNSTALQAQVDPSRLGLEEETLFLHPVSFDEHTIHTLASFFGELEEFTPWGKNQEAQAPEFNVESLPFPHNVPRMPAMTPGCFQVKWTHRNDCVSALMTLRRIPYLTVTWAHQPSLYSRENGPSSSNAAYPLYLQDPRTMVSYPSSATHFPTQYSHQNARQIYPLHNSHGYTASDPSLQLDFPRRTTPADGGYPPPLLQWSSPGNSPSPDTPVYSSNRIQEEDNSSDPDKAENADSSDIDQTTPTLVHSPLTPKTPNSHFPVTPTDTQFSRQRQELNYTDGNSVDRMSLFIGGLDSGAWDEDRIARLFSTYGRILTVHIIRPHSSKAAFAFVQFDNTISPTRAIAEQHNRQYDGRPMRVQLRDCNPDRSFYSRANRNSRVGRFPVRGPGYMYQKDYHGGPPISPSRAPGDSTENEEAYDEYRGVAQFGSDSNDSNENCEAPPSTLSLPSVAGSPVPLAREQDSNVQNLEQSVDVTPPANPSVAVPGAYYPLGPWAPPFPQLMPAPYYPGYPVGPQTQAPASDNAFGSQGHPPYWPMPVPPMAYIPYGRDMRRQEEQAAFVSPTEAPLQPTGFMQHQQGTLIPVYQPEALQQYMTLAAQPITTNGTPPIQSQPSQSQHQTQGQVQAGATNPVWPAGTPQPYMIPAPMVRSFPPYPTNPGWGNHEMMYPQPVQGFPPPRGIVNHVPPTRRNTPRKGIQGNTNNRRHHGVPPGGRPAGTMTPNGTPGVGVASNFPRGSPPEWNQHQWNGNGNGVRV